MLIPLLSTAFTNRSALLQQLHTEKTDAYRLFLSSVEGLARVGAISVA